MKTLRMVGIWLAILVCFMGYGVWLSRGPSGTIYLRDAIESAVLFGALGLGVATCVTMGWVLISRVRSWCLHRHWAVLLLAASSVVSAMLTPLVFFVVGHIPLPEEIRFSPDDMLLSSGEPGIPMLAIMFIMVCFAILAFLVPTVCVFLPRKLAIPNETDEGFEKLVPPSDLPATPNSDRQL